MDMDSNTILCTTCGSRFRERWELKWHNQKFHDFRVFKCEICNVEVIGQRKFHGHKNIQKKKACNICWNFFSINSFGNHRATCEGITLQCDLCEYETPKKYPQRKTFEGKRNKDSSLPQLQKDVHTQKHYQTY